MEIDRQIQALKDRLSYTRDIFGNREDDNIRLLTAKLSELLVKEESLPGSVLVEEVARLEDFFDFSERKLDLELTPMDRVRIVRHPQRVCLKDILENVYDNYTEIGGQGEYNIDPSMLIARAYFTRRVGDKVLNQMVMVIGQEKGHGEAYRNGGSVKPWGNAKALHYMKVAETENIPVHTFVFTPGAYPVEDWPGAAQQIARNLYEMAGLRVPVISVFSEGGSGGAEAVGLGDRRIMLSHGYYSVISPEGAAAIEGGLRGGDRATPELIEKCARQLGITADDNLANGYVDKVLREPPLGARAYHYEFFRELRRELIQATNEAVSEVKSMKLYRAMVVRGSRTDDAESIYMRWNLSQSALNRLVERRQRKFLAMSRHARLDGTGIAKRAVTVTKGAVDATHSFLRYDLIGKPKKRLDAMFEELGAEAHLLRHKVLMPLKRALDKSFPGVNGKETKADEAVRDKLTQLSSPEEGAYLVGNGWAWSSPRSQEDRTISCPNARIHHCPDLWVPDLFGDFAGVCPHCGHHFPMEYRWYLENVFNYAVSREFNRELESINPLGYEQFDGKLDKAKEKTGLKSACITFDSVIDGVEAVVAVFCAPFRGGSVGAAEGEKFIRAAARAKRKRRPFIAYVHGTAGIRIQEGVNGVIQMPRCTIAVRRYIDAGGLYLVLYDTNSYAGPVASFLGCSPYQFAVQSSNIGFAGPGVITETTGMTVAPDYHRCYHALSRGHIHGIWDRREVKKNLHQSLLTMGGRNLYYR
ncbi:acetyl-CoA carboxylase carboxyl transferase subunit alpha/beta [Pseudodesulfovibrio cashew]|uniref:Acetyl-coenzyme A carboxylase carboxyl transferase subunits beta/alpha n=1 Tax=Pseudodesulfovibrio cashew TaxID=2678688 RepID=A0A6I6JFA5_9BACT|nr:acetyl-CoA carboxylase carboxyl transferase subunit alpha/beta [Pseudodesulfovibrio cashew]QGY41516.1 acetyl-CoA carboxylase carboxyl transferase subunit alpha/beta [Pseudodesulfovibrio cashew]